MVSKYYTLKTFLLSLWLQIINIVVIFIYNFNLRLINCASFTIFYSGIKYIKSINNSLTRITNRQDNLFDRHIFLQNLVQKLIIDHNNYLLVYDKVFKSISIFW